MKMDAPTQGPSRITFTETERQLVRELVDPMINLLDSKKTDATSSRRKQEAWKKLAREYNASILTHNKATPLQLKRLWANMKARARDFRIKEKQQSFTGGGPYLNVCDAESEEVLSIMPQVMTVVEVAQDSDTILDNTAPAGDDDNEGWQRKRLRSNSSGVEVQDIIIEGISTNLNEPRPSTSRVGVSITNELGISTRQDAVNVSQVEVNTTVDEPGPSASQGGVSATNAEPLQIGATTTVTGRQIHINRNKTTLEDLKIQLVNDDILYRKLKAEEDIKFVKESNKIKLEMMREEYKSLKEKNALDIEEKKLKIAILKKTMRSSNKNCYFF